MYGCAIKEEGEAKINQTMTGEGDRSCTMVLQETEKGPI